MPTSSTMLSKNAYSTQKNHIRTNSKAKHSEPQAMSYQNNQNPKSQHNNSIQHSIKHSAAALPGEKAKNGKSPQSNKSHTPSPDSKIQQPPATSTPSFNNSFSSIVSAANYWPLTLKRSTIKKTSFMSYKTSSLISNFQKVPSIPPPPCANGSSSMGNPSTHAFKQMSTSSSTPSSINSKEISVKSIEKKSSPTSSEDRSPI